MKITVTATSAAANITVSAVHIISFLQPESAHTEAKENNRHMILMAIMLFIDNKSLI